MGRIGLCLPLILVVISMLQPGSEGARILCVSHQFKSHMLMVHSVAEGLLDRGHEVYTVFSDQMSVPDELVKKGFKILKYHTPEDSTILATTSNAKEVLDSVFSGDAPNLGAESLKASRECIDMDNDAVLDSKIKQLKFDIALIDVFPVSSCMQFMGLKYDIPFVQVPPMTEIETTRTPVLPSFTPYAILEYSENMVFTQRLINSIMTFVNGIPALSPFTAVKDTSLIQKYSKDPKVRTWLDVSRKAELFLVTRGAILEYPSPLLPNVINIECLTCKPAEPLEASVAEIVKHANGVIIVSFGSLIVELPDHVTEKFMKAFAMRKEVIFWRYKGKLPKGIPANVRIMKWLPQNSLLGHPKTILFITHAGNNGQYESVYHGVPMLAFPLFAEQPHNAHRMVYHGYGLQINIRNFTSEELGDKIAEVIKNPTYRAKIQKAARIIRDSLLDARQTAAHWVEHVLEFGSDHLRSYALKMPWYSYYMIDILLFAEVIIMVCIAVLILLCYCAVRLLSRSTASNKTKQKKH